MVLIIVAYLLGAGIYLFTLYIAYLTGFVPMLLTLAFPVLGQIYWIIAIWTSTGVFLNLLTVLCIAWLVIIAGAFGLTADCSLVLHYPLSRETSGPKPLT